MQQGYQYPFKISVSFHKVIQLYEERLRVEKTSIATNYIESLLAYVKEFPEIVEGIDTEEKLAFYADTIKIVLDDIFPNMLTSNEIKAATVPFTPVIFYKSERFEKYYLRQGKIMN